MNAKSLLAPVLMDYNALYNRTTCINAKYKNN